MLSEDKKIIHQLNRLEGQVKSLKKMYKDDRECLEIIQQITAAKSALNRAANLILEEETCHFIEEGKKEKILPIIKKIFKINN